jgi:hypothetical protein
VQQVSQVENEICASKYETKAKASAEDALSWHQVGIGIGLIPIPPSMPAGMNGGYVSILQRKRQGLGILKSSPARP